MARHRMPRSKGFVLRALGIAIAILLLAFGGAMGGLWALEDEPPTVEPAIVVVEGETATPAPTATPTPTLSPTASPTPSPSPTPEPPRTASIRIRAVGDLMAHDVNLDAAKTGDGYDFTSFFEEIAPTLREADLTIGNLETTISDEKSEVDDSFFTGYPIFRSPGSYLDALKGAGFDVLTLANNHILDKGITGIEATCSALEARGIPYAGAYPDEESAGETLLCEANGIVVAVLAYTEYANAATNSSYAVNFLKKERLEEDARAAREQGADIVLAMVHWGQEYLTKESSSQRTWARRMADAGFDIVLGSHPHVVQPAAWLETEEEDGETRRTFVAYSMGNFISNQRTVPRDAGVIFDFQIEKDLETGVCTILEVSFIPTWVLKSNQDNKPTFAVLPAGMYLEEEEYPGLVKGYRSRVRAVWKEITAQMEPCGATALAK